MPLKLKLTDDGKAAVIDANGHPVYVHDDGKEAGFDADATVATLNSTIQESKKYRSRAQAAEEKLTAFGDIDPAAAKKALDTVKNLDDKKLVDAGEIERVKAAAIEAVEAKYKPVVVERDKLLDENKQEKLGNAFGRSKVIADKLILPADAVRKLFGDHFQVEDGKIVAKDKHGNIINSRTRPGEPADFDEAMETVIEAYPYKDTILKGKGSSGDGKPSGGGSGGGGGGKRSMTREQFNALPPEEQMAGMTSPDASKRIEVVD